ncbi:Homocysteine S-methyltransferase [Lasiosphaeria hispida]|uniref:Homocysteine S-methyltransferase n=1 Tax=Lasiosphaeria hispida TaxID=260671 RepID=A0AAJ0MJE2_9PEZI|nr:Homocysteine S-methyltransferase [Lasiosphaeria hispida]
MDSPIPIRILDGGLGTTLEDQFHVEFGSKTPLWSSHLLVADQKTLLDCQTEFGAAGADIISTATYNVSITGFAKTKTPDWPRGVSIADLSQFLGDAILIACEARAAFDSEVALSLGPYGATMQPSTEYNANYDEQHRTAQQLFEWHLNRILCFRKTASLLSPVKYFAFETVPCLSEIHAIRMLLRSAYLSGPSGPCCIRTPAWISCVFPGDDDQLPDGTSAEDAVAAMLGYEDMGGPGPPYPPWGIGINCTKVHKLDSLVRKYERAVQRLIDDCHIFAWPSLVLYPDGTNGEVYNPETKKWELPEGTKPPETPWEVQLANVVNATSRRAKWHTIIVGGCCKTTPADIARLRKLLIGPDTLRSGPSEGDSGAESSQ